MRIKILTSQNFGYDNFLQTISNWYLVCLCNPKLELGFGIGNKRNWWKWVVGNGGEGW